MRMTIYASIAAAACCLTTANAPLVRSATLPVTFEPPTYSTGSVVDQDGWVVLLPEFFSADGIDVVDTNPISGGQSLQITGGSPTRAAGTLVGQLANIAWSVRVDNTGGGTFETGLIDDAQFGMGSTPLTIVFAANGQLQYYDGETSTDTNYDGDPTWTSGTVYRIEATNIDYEAHVYDISIFDTSTNTAVVNQSLPFATTNDTNIGWYVLMRDAADGALATVDDFMEITSTPVVPGDFDGDSDVDGADFVVWQTNFPTATGATLDEGDADNDGDVDGADFVVWQTNFPTTAGPAVAAVPEPHGLILAAIGGLIATTLRRRRR